MARKTVGFNVDPQERRLIEDVRFAERHESLSDLFRAIILPAVRRRHKKYFPNHNPPASSRGRDRRKA